MFSKLYNVELFCYSTSVNQVQRVMNVATTNACWVICNEKLLHVRIRHRSREWIDLERWTLGDLLSVGTSGISRRGKEDE